MEDFYVRKVYLFRPELFYPHLLQQVRCCVQAQRLGFVKRQGLGP